MSLNVIDSNESININTFHKDMNKLPLISLINNQNFRLRSKKKGKLLNKPIYSGFNKNTMSSIPRDVEIILLDKNKEEIFSSSNQNILSSLDSSNLNIFGKTTNKTANENARLSAFISKTLDEKKINNALTNSNNNNSKKLKKNKSMNLQSNIRKTKDYWKFYKSKETPNKNMYNDKKDFSMKLYQSQFLPGPSDYSSDKSYDWINKQNKYRYNGLFKSGSYQKNKNIKNPYPGPGSYFQLKNINNNNKQVNINLGTKEKRFKNLFSSASLSPWYYSASTKENIKESNKSSNDKGSLNKGDVYDFKKYIIKEETDDRGMKRQFYVEDTPSKEKNEIKNDIKSNFNNKSKIFENKSTNENKLNNLLKKYIIVRDSEKDYEVPGPGQYNIYVGFDKILKDKAIEKLQFHNKQENLIPEEVLKNCSMNKNNNQHFSFFNEWNGNNNINSKNDMKNSKSCENILNKNSSGTLPFLSREKRIKFQDIILSKHTPGPCYYFNDEPNQIY